MQSKILKVRGPGPQFDAVLISLVLNSMIDRMRLHLTNEKITAYFLNEI